MRKKLSFADKYYIEHNRDGDPKRIAVMLGVAEESVEAELAELAAKVPPKTSFDTPADGVVSMTGAQSMKDDATPQGSNKAYLERYKKNIAKIREDGQLP